MRKKIKAFLLILITIFPAYVGYRIYTHYEKKKSFQFYVYQMLHSYCENIIHNSFNKHASSFSTIKDSLHEINSKEMYGNLIFGYYGMRIRGHSTIYFEGYAPQDIYCNAHILFNKANQISSKDLVTFIIWGINYLPKGFANPEDTKLTVDALNKLYPLSFGASPFNKFAFGIDIKNAQ